MADHKFKIYQHAKNPKYLEIVDQEWVLEELPNDGMSFVLFSEILIKTEEAKKYASLDEALDGDEEADEGGLLRLTFRPRENGRR